MNRKKYIIFGAIILSVAILFATYQTPENRGKRMAKSEYRSYNRYIQNYTDYNNKFIRKFKKAKYHNRHEARLDYLTGLGKIKEKYAKDEDRIRNKSERNTHRYRHHYKKYKRYENALEKKARKYNLHELFILTNEIGATGIWNSDTTYIPLEKNIAEIISTVTPAAPPVSDQIKHSLEGYTLKFGLSDSWYSGFEWVFSPNEVQSIKLLGTNSDNNSLYKARMAIHIKRYACNIDIIATTLFRLPDDDDWLLDTVLVEDVSIVQTHQYDDKISCRIEDLTWSRLHITNNSGDSLVVFGYIDYYILDNNSTGRVKFRIFMNDENSIVWRFLEPDGGLQTFGHEEARRYEITLVEKCNANYSYHDVYGWGGFSGKFD